MISARPAAIVVCVWAFATSTPVGQRGATGSISGSVTAADSTSTPLAGAIVSLTGGGLARPLTTVTRVDGTFSLADVPAGEHQLAARKAPYLAMTYGASRPGRPGVAIATEAGQRLDHVSIVLPLGAVITGTISDETGSAVSEVAVTAFRMSADGSATAAGSAQTDDRGAYRVFGLPPGQYIVAGTRPWANGLSAESRRTEELDARLSALETGWKFAPRLAPGSAKPMTPSTVYAIAPTFFPGTTTVDQATILTTDVAQEYRADFSVALTPAAAVQGVLRTDDGSPIPALSPVLEQTGPLLPVDYATRPRLVIRPTSADPRFSFAGVVPGEYQLAAIAEATATRPRLSGILELHSNGSDVSDVSVILSPGIHVTGTTVIDGGSPQVPRNVSSLRITLAMTATVTGRVPPLSFRVASPRAITIRADGSFDIPDVIPGAYMLSATGAGGLFLRSAFLDGHDALDVSVVLTRSTAPKRIVLTLTDHGAELSGTIQSSGGGSAAECVIVAFATADAFWGQHSRRVRAVRPSTDNHFVMGDLPGGEYFLTALTDVDPDDLADKAFLAGLAHAAVRVTVPDGGRLVQNLALGARAH